MSVTVVIPVKNEELHLRACLDAVVGWTDHVFVVDSGSEDATAAIADAYAARGVERVEHAYEGPADQKNWALDHLPIPSRWVLFLDADERVTPGLAAEILGVTARADEGPVGYRIDRRIVWQGREIRHGGWSPNWNLRLLRRGCGRYERRRVHEHVVVHGPVGRLRGHLVHEDLRDVTFQIAKHNRYSNAEAAEYVELLEKGCRDPYGRLFSRDPLARRRFIKTRIWSRLPMKGLLYFVWAYVIRLGFLDGRIGFRFHLMHALFKEFDDLKLWELRRARAESPCRHELGGARADAAPALRDLAERGRGLARPSRRTVHPGDVPEKEPVAG